MEEGRDRDALDMSEEEIQKLIIVQRRRLATHDDALRTASSDSFVEVRTQNVVSRLRQSCLRPAACSQVSDDAPEVMADLVELEEALKCEKREMEVLRRVTEIELKEEEMFPAGMFCFC